MITRDEVLMGRDKAAPLTKELEANLAKLLGALNKFRKAYGKPMRVTSGYRPATINKIMHGSKASNHMLCLACDFADVGHQLANYCENNLDLLASCGLYLESPGATPTWVHLQVVPPKSGKRVFIP